jgi:hypothetical protein
VVETVSVSCLMGPLVPANVSTTRELFTYVQKKVLDICALILFNTTSTRHNFWLMRYLKLRALVQMFYVLYTLMSRHSV